MTGHDDLPVAARARRLEERLIAAGLTSDDEMDEFLTRLYTNASPVNGARMVARAWTDPQYRDLLLSDGDAAAKDMGFGDLSLSHPGVWSPRRENGRGCWSWRAGVRCRAVAGAG